MIVLVNEADPKRKNQNSKVILSQGLNPDRSLLAAYVIVNTVDLTT